MKKLLFLVALATLNSSCATLFNGTKQIVRINSTPPSANILVNGQIMAKTPADIEIKRKTKIINLEKEGFQNHSFLVSKKTSPNFYWNIGLWAVMMVPGAIGMWVDIATGAAYRIESPINIELKENDKSRGSIESK